MGDGAATGALLEPIAINKLKLANRMVLGPMAAIAPNPDGTASDQTVAFFTTRARGGVGMIIVGGSCATTRSVVESPVPLVLRFDIEETIPSLRRLTDAVHAHNVPIIAELSPGFGRMGVPAPGRPNISASPLNVVIPEERFPRGFNIPGGRTTSTPQEATIEQIEQIERETIASADRARRA